MPAATPGCLDSRCRITVLTSARGQSPGLLFTSQWCALPMWPLTSDMPPGIFLSNSVHTEGFGAKPYSTAYENPVKKLIIKPRIINKAEGYLQALCYGSGCMGPHTRACGEAGWTPSSPA